jgi:hypothetical protein
VTDTLVGLPIKTLSTDTVRVLLIDSAGTNAAAISAAGRISVDASGVPVPITDNAGSLTVDATELTTLSGAVRAEDAASADAHTGIPAMVVRKATPANTSGTDGDYEMLQVNAGRLWVSAVLDTALPTGANTIGNIGTVTTVTTVSTITNVVHIDDNAGSLTVDGTVAVSGTVTVDSELTTADLDTGAGTDTRAVVGLVGAASGGGVLIGATSAGALKNDITTIAGTAPTTVGKLDVKGADGDVFVRQATAGNLNATVVGTGTFAVQATVAATATNIAKAEDVASADADVGVPAMAVRKASPANTSGTDGDYEMLQISAGRLWVSAVVDTALPTGSNSIGNIGTVATVTTITNVVHVDDNSGSLTVDAPVGTPAYVRLSDGSAALVGQKAMAASIPVVMASDQTAIAANITQVAGATQSATNPLFVRLTDGSSAYTAGTDTPSTPKLSTVTSSALGAGAAVDLDFTLVTNGTTGQLQGVDATATVPIKLEIKTVNSSNTPTTRVVLFASAYGNIQWRSPYRTYITQAGAASNARFRATITNKDASNAADVYASAYWNEV